MLGVRRLDSNVYEISPFFDDRQDFDGICASTRVPCPGKPIASREPSDLIAQGRAQ